MAYCLVYWENENLYSVLARRKVITGLNDVEIIGQRLPILWKSKKDPVLGNIINIGSKNEMKKEEEILVAAADEQSFRREELLSMENEQIAQNKPTSGLEETSTKRKLNRLTNVNGSDCALMSVEANEPSTIVGSAANYEDLENPSNHATSTSESPSSAVHQSSSILDEKNMQIRRLELLLAKSEKENRVFKKIVKAKRSAEENGENEDIGHGITIDKGYLDYIKLAFVSKPSIFFRKLLFESGAFDLKLVAESSLKGKKYKEGIGRPGLGPQKLEALKAFTILQCGLQPRTYEMSEFERKIQNVCSDGRKNFGDKSLVK